MNLWLLLPDKLTLKTNKFLLKNHTLMLSQLLKYLQVLKATLEDLMIMKKCPNLLTLLNLLRFLTTKRCLSVFLAKTSKLLETVLKT